MKTLDQLALQGPLPSPEGTALALLELCRREEVGLAEVARVAQTDPALSGRLLRQANSAARGGRPVAAVSEAIQHLGLAAVRRLALGFSLLDRHATGACEGFDYPGFWSHGLLMAVAAQELGVLTRAAAPDELFVCGLLARIGRLGLATAYPAEYAGVLARADSVEAAAPLEQECLGVDHNELTAALLLDWGLPMALAEPAMHHERPEAAGFEPDSRAWRLTHLLHLAGRIADLGLADAPARPARAEALAYAGGCLGLDAEILGATVDRTLPIWQEWGRLLDVPVAEPPSFANSAAAPATHPSSPPAAEGTGLRVLLVDGNAASRQPLERLLVREGGHEVLTAPTCAQALALSVEAQPHVVIVDRFLGGMDGLELCRTLRAADWGRALYILVLTSVVAEGALNEILDAGADDYLLKPATARDLRLRLRAAARHALLLAEGARDRARLRQLAADLAIANHRLEHTALTDPLTELPNRRAAMELLERAWSTADREGHELAVMMIDIDRFKGINDTHGHAAGDAVLHETAQALRGAMRRGDGVCRVGGEEFLVVCPRTGLKTALPLADRLRRAVRALAIETAGKTLRTSVSIGVAEREKNPAGMEALITAADHALFAAKQAGRDCICAQARGKLHCGAAPVAAHESTRHVL